MGLVDSDIDCAIDYEKITPVKSDNVRQALPAGYGPPLTIVDGKILDSAWFVKVPTRWTVQVHNDLEEVWDEVVRSTQTSRKNLCEEVRS
jgi:hypothetical protein